MLLPISNKYYYKMRKSFAHIYCMVISQLQLHVINRNHENLFLFLLANFTSELAELQKH